MSYSTVRTNTIVGASSKHQITTRKGGIPYLLERSTMASKGFLVDTVIS